jgi:hypothetical protein
MPKLWEECACGRVSMTKEAQSLQSYIRKTVYCYLKDQVLILI